MIRPCANCGTVIAPDRSSTIFCSELCKQVAKAIRYMRSGNADGRDEQSDVQYAITVRLAHIAAGGYHERERTLSPEQRSEVIKKFEGLCAVCHAPGTEIDHIKGSSDDSLNLQLLCTPCHRTKTAKSFRTANSQDVKEVFTPIRKRATAPAPLQPSDMPDWEYRLWACDLLPGDPKAREVWKEVVKRAMPLPPQSANRAQACRGFPPELAPWSWYKGQYELDGVADEFH